MMDPLHDQAQLREAVRIDTVATVLANTTSPELNRGAGWTVSESM